ncbi:MAG: hypothetical protein A4E47_00803 [Methanosaeta sp. PtaU1.Bin028]|nr:MAG: hypothetical protein A4E47_00803 [Methanosaeta sp. PtaU1.Bin028]
MTFILALDPAQLRDWSALAAVDMQYRPEEKRFGYDLVAMGRKQGLPYDQIVDWVVRTLKKPEFRRDQPPEFLLDATGVGVAVRDMLAAKGVRMKAVTITSGETCTRQGPIYHVGKARMIGTFLGAFDAGKVRINPSMPIWPHLEKEMLGFRAEMSSQGRAKFEAEQGENDDMLFALAMAVWFGEEVRRGKRL